ncbi:MAG: SDR family NAD(P)-dependent oxidoreductase [Longimicrobiaceae bacterium]
MKEWSYQGRWALVTGASSGLGERFARELASRGMKVALTARREERLLALAGELGRAHGTESLVFPADLAEAGAAKRLWQRAAGGGRHFHLLVSNAGFGALGNFHQQDPERLAKMVRVNVTSLLELARLALPGMRARGEGGIVNVSSLAGFQPVPYMAAYAATKAFVLSFSRALHAENREAGVRVVCLCPGRTPTEFQDRAGSGRVTPGTPGYQTPERVVVAALAALERNRELVVPGRANRVGAVLSKLLPGALVVRLVARGMERRMEDLG